jgi:preprotein translocase subunit YajC
MTDVKNLILQIRTLNNEQLNEVSVAVRDQRTWLTRDTARSLNVGDTVTFDAKTRGIITGRVTKVNVKTVAVKCNRTGTNWKVHASLLKKVDTTTVVS